MDRQYILVFFSAYRDLSLGGGSLFVLGVYNIQLCQWIFQRRPDSITATGAVNANKADAEVYAEFSYGDDAVAHISISMLKMLSNTAIIRGTKGQITVMKYCMIMLSHCRSGF